MSNPKILVMKRYTLILSFIFIVTNVILATMIFCSVNTFAADGDKCSSGGAGATACSVGIGAGAME